MSMFDTFDRTGAVDFPFAPPVVFRAVKEGIPKLKGMKLDEADAFSGRITVKTGVSAMSWGEKVTISIQEAAPGRSRVSVASGAKTIMGSATTHGKNRKNIEQIISEASRILQTHGATWAQEMGVAVEPAAPTSSADEIEKLAALHKQGILTDDEFAAKKRQILGL